VIRELYYHIFLIVVLIFSIASCMDEQYCRQKRLKSRISCGRGKTKEGGSLNYEGNTCCYVGIGACSQ
jgi:hypothetical protein